MELGQVFGSTFMQSLTSPVLVIGRDTWTRDDLAHIHVTHIGAARMVTVIAEEYGAKDTADLYRKLGPRQLAGMRGRGLTCLYVMWRAFKSKGLSPDQWYRTGTEGAVRTFLTVKSNEALSEKRAKKGRRMRLDFQPTRPGRQLTDKDFESGNGRKKHQPSA